MYRGARTAIMRLWGMNVYEALRKGKMSETLRKLVETEMEQEQGLYDVAFSIIISVERRENVIIFTANGIPPYIFDEMLVGVGSIDA